MCNLKDIRRDCLTEAGHMCLCEKHSDIISDQKTSISQLRQRLNELELAKPPGTSYKNNYIKPFCVQWLGICIYKPFQLIGS